MIAELSRFANHHASAVIDEKVRADLRAGMDVDACAAMRPLCHHAWNQWNVFFIENMSRTLDGNCLQARISQDDLFKAVCGWITLKSSLHIRLQQRPHLGQRQHEAADERLTVGGCRVRIQAHRAAHFDVQPLTNTRHELMRHELQLVRRHRLLGEKTRKEHMQQILTQGRDSPLRR